MRTYSLDDVHETRKRRDSWWTVYFVDPVACRVALPVANRTRITPNALTVLSLVLGAVSAACLAMNQLVAGAVVFYLSFMIDCVDGKVARLKGTGTPFGLWLDYVGDRIRVVLCAGGLAYGQYALTGEVAYVVLGAAVAVLDLFRYVNAPQMKRVREAVREERQGAAGPAAAPDDGPLGPALEPCGPPELEEDTQPLERVPRAPGFFRRLNRFLARHRVRSHLISGIEFHAAVFVIAPLAGAWALIPLATAAGALLLANEVFLVYRMWRFTRRHAVASSRESREHVLV
ncbi:CDP-alcohol phosphatidyltransferase family protein [Actinomadura sp. ATCC 31491]|uniref:CDP-alcohol phosphatidyltransferase family protein n=1 Tax=Actinomadura luzonensis TaxID=2805427 RepID=A0ABT0GA09_9ACTN|nr:CDP-alcohol phosphatidyltransferase family protein [Actinomadura luzonensis]MCK2221432.1 CDP-alcohol phosphatidyltransferase family protein [Actinomadura luzonensis]